MPGTLERALEAGFRIRPGEERRTAIMAAYAASAIGAVVVGRSVRDALYLAHGTARGLSWLYILSSAAIVAVSYGYARVADKVPRGALNAISAASCAAMCAAFWGLVQFSAGRWVYPALYVFVEAMASLVVIQFWTMANDVFHAREAKRLFGLIGAGGTLANVIFGLLVSRYARRIGAPNLLWLMVVQLAACAILARAGARLISTAPLIAGRRARRTVPVLSRAGLSFLGNRHLMLVAAVAAVSAAAVTVVDFQFKLAAASVLRQNDLAGYFGQFYGICGGIALAVQIWITGRLLERYGILASLLPLPAGLALGSGFSAAVPNPGLFVASLAKGSDTIFRYTINDASMQLLYVPVQPSVRGRAMAFIDGILKPTAIALTGAVLLFYEQSGGKGRPLTLAVLLLVAFWILLLLRARSEYVRSLVESLERRQLDLAAIPLAATSDATVRALRVALKGDAPTALHAISLLQHVPGIDFSTELHDLLAHADPRIRAAAVEQLGEGRVEAAHGAMRELLADPAPEVRAAALAAVCAIEREQAVSTVLPFLDAANMAVVRAAGAAALVRHAGLDGVLAAAEPLNALLCANDPNDRAAAAEALGNIGVRGFYRPLVAFLRDRDPKVRRRAIAAAGKLRNPELLPPLIEQLKDRRTVLEAASALTAFGPGIVPALREVLTDEAADAGCRRGVALVLQRLATPEAVEALVLALPAGSAPVRKAAARSLSRITRRRQGIGVDVQRVEAAIHAELAAARLALAGLKRLDLPPLLPGQLPRTVADLLALALLEERDHRVLQALLLLEVLLPQVRLEAVGEYLRSDSAASRGNAIEVLDHALPDPWKRLVLAALDEVKRRADAVQPDPRPAQRLVAALAAGESGGWVAACAVRWSQDARGLDRRALAPALRLALRSARPALREAAACALFGALPRDEARGLLAGLLQDSAASVRRAAAGLLKVRKAIA
jgi:HEAT repeat protein